MEINLVELKQRTPNERKAYIEGYQYAIKEMKSYINSLDNVMQLIRETEEREDE